MNTVMLNTISLDDGRIIKKGASGGGGVTINNQDKSVDITENGTTEIVADTGYTGLGKVTINTNVASSGGDTPSRPTWTGHADAEGLRAIGWTDEDIAYYQENGVNWNEEDDEYHKVTDDNKSLYGVLTANNISSYKRRIVYLPKIDTSGKTTMSYMFENCNSLVAIPQLDTSNVTKMYAMFRGCYSLVSIPPLDTSNVTTMSYMFENCNSLVSIPPLDTSNVTDMSYMFNYCYSLVSIPPLDTSNVTDMSYMFNYCYSLVSIPPLDTSNVTTMSYMFGNCYSLVSIPPLDTSNVTTMNYMFYYCYSLVSIPPLDTSNVTTMNNIFNYCYSLVYPNIKNNKTSISCSDSSLLSKESLLYIINNAASGFNLTLSGFTYDKWATDADVEAALEAHPDVSLIRW